MNTTPPQVALHGMFGGGSDWAGLLPQEGAWQTPLLWQWWRGPDARVPDLHDQPGAAFDLWARQFNAAFASRPPGRLLGYSLGGRLALHAWLQQPVRWRELWIISTHPGLEDEGERWHRRQTDGQWAERLLSLPPDEFLTKWDQQTVLGGRAAADAAGRLQRVTEWRAEMAMALRHWSLGCQRPLWDQIARTLHEHDTRLHWVTGTEDAKFTLLAKRLQEHAPGIIRHEIQNAGHRVPWDRPQEWLQCLARGMTPAAP